MTGVALEIVLSWTRITMAGVFAVSVLGVVTDPVGFRRTVARFRVGPRRHAASLDPVLAVAVPVAEVVVIVLVLAPGTARWGLLLSVALLAAFTSGLVAVLRRGISTPCHCTPGSAEHDVGARHVARTAVLLVVALAGSTLAALGPGVPTARPSAWLVAALAAIPPVVLFRYFDDVADVVVGQSVP